MTIKTLTKRLTGGREAPAAEPAEQTEAARAARLTAAGARLKELLEAAAAESGQRVGNLHELQGTRHVLASVRIKARLAAGEPEGRVRRRVDEALDDLEDEVARLTAETRGLEQEQAAEQARRSAAELEETAADMVTLNVEISGSPELAAFVAWLRPVHARAVQIRQRLIAASGNSARRIPDSRPYLGLREWTLAELAAKAVTLHAEREETR